MTNIHQLKETGLYRIRAGKETTYVAASSIRAALDTWEMLDESRKRNPNVTYVNGTVTEIKELGRVVMAENGET